MPAAESVEGAPKTQSTDDGRMVDPDVDTTAGLEGASDADDILEKEKLRKALSDVVFNVSKPNPGKRCREGGHPSDEVLSWPTQGKQLVSENEYGIFAKAFPKLFPRGSGDISGAENWKSVTLATWGEYLVQHKSGRFAQHPRFRYYLFNRINREACLSKGSIIHKQTMDDISTVED